MIGKLTESKVTEFAMGIRALRIHSCLAQEARNCEQEASRKQLQSEVKSLEPARRDTGMSLDWKTEETGV